jgi:LemA protein
VQTIKAYQLVAMSVAALSLSACSYEKLAEQDRAVKAEWAQVQDALQRRARLVLSLVDIVNAHASDERTVLQAAEDSCARLTAARTAVETIDAANQQSAALARLLAVVETHPQIKTDETFKQLMDQLADSENRVAVERMRYNGFVQQYNLRRRQFPGVQVARLFKFGGHPFFEVPPPGRDNPAGQAAPKP